MTTFTIYLSLIINFLISIAFASDPTPLKDFCVADPTSQLSISGPLPLPCKDPKSVTADNFYFTGLNKTGNMSNPFLAGTIFVGVKEVPGLNTLGLSMARIDLGPGGLDPLHYHPRASEMHIVINGSLEVGFISPENGYKYYSKILNVGDMFVVPTGLMHIQRNVGNGTMSSYAILNSQNYGVHEVARAVFGANPSIDTSYLAKGFQLDEETIKKLQDKRWAA